MFRKASFNSIFSTLDGWYRYRLSYSVLYVRAVWAWIDVCFFGKIYFVLLIQGKKNTTRKQFYSVFPFCELMHTFVFSRAIIKIAAQKEHHPKLMGPSGFRWAHPISAFLSHSFSHKKCMSLLHQITFRLFEGCYILTMAVKIMERNRVNGCFFKRPVLLDGNFLHRIEGHSVPSQTFYLCSFVFPLSDCLIKALL